MTVVTFTVLGKPQPAGSKRAFRHPHTGRIIVTDAAAKAKPWKQQVAGAALELVDELLEGPLSLEVTFYVARPKGHYGARGLRPSAPEFPAVRPDVTKLLRGTEDALTGVLWRDDAQIVDQVARKRYGTPERCEIRASTVEAGAMQVAA